MVGEDDNDTYDFNVLEDGSLGVDSITEGADSIVGSDGGDLLDFTDVQPHTSVNGITLDISITSEQTLTTLGQLKLRLSSGTGIERVNGSDHATRGNDSIIGNSLANIISGKKGNDTIRGGSGSDTLRGDDGDDQFYAADSATDSLDGGLGTDSARLLLTERDSFDAVTSIENS